MASAAFPQTNVRARSFQPLTKRRIALTRSATLPRLPRRTYWRVRMDYQLSTMFIHDARVGVKWQ